jgi:N-acetylneuraminate synthase
MRPIFLATGASTLKEVSTAVKILKSTGNNKIVLMQAITQYPSPIEKSNLLVIQSFKQKFNLNVGYSDHSPGSLAILGSVALGASVIEKHFTDDSTLAGPDHPHSMNASSFKKMVSDIRTLESALGNGVKKVESCENQTRKLQRRGIWTTKIIQKGERFSNENIQTLRPVMGIEASMFGLVLGKKCKKKLPANSPVNLTYL